MLNAADISELNLPKSTTIHFPGGKDKLLSFEITIKTDEGFYRRNPSLFDRIACHLFGGMPLYLSASNIISKTNHLKIMDQYCRGGVFKFTFEVPPVYPHEPPKVKCLTKVCIPRLADLPRRPSACAQPTHLS